MAETPISYDVDADNQFKKAIAKAIQSGLDLSFSMGESARIIKKDAGKNFILKGSGQYDPLNKQYFRRKKILAPSAPILVGTKPGKIKKGKKIQGGGISGKLRNSIIRKTKDSIILIGKQSLEVGTKAVTSDGESYPTFIQEGTKNIPARKFLFFSQAMVKQIINTINADIANQLPK